ncbi:MAG: hypothetical protein JWR90_3819 [Marmoricola sp.]|jgi:hypothetical protein|nr:hypothetical protein [Marmoricola sp.]
MGVNEAAPSLRYHKAAWFEPILTGVGCSVLVGGTLTLSGIGIWRVIQWIWA